MFSSGNESIASLKSHFLKGCDVNKRVFFENRGYIFSASAFTEYEMVFPVVAVARIS
jgi:hypothetical protein